MWTITCVLLILTNPLNSTYILTVWAYSKFHIFWLIYFLSFVSLQNNVNHYYFTDTFVLCLKGNKGVVCSNIKSYLDKQMKINNFIVEAYFVTIKHYFVPRSRHTIACVCVCWFCHIWHAVLFQWKKYIKISRLSTRNICLWCFKVLFHLF